MSEFANTFNDLVAGTLTDLENSDATSVGDYALNGNLGLKTVTLPNVESVGQYAFSGCTNLGEAVLTKAESIGPYAFNNCTNLYTITAPNLTTIGERAFYWAGFLDVTFPSATTIGPYLTSGPAITRVDLTNITAIPAEAFQDSRSLTELILRGNTLVPLNGTNALNNTPIASGKGYIYVKDDLVDRYKAATNWSTYSARFQPLSSYPLALPDETITDSWEDILEAEDNGTYSTKYSVGDIKCVQIGGSKIPMQIVAFDTDTLEAGGTAKITWMSLYFTTKMQMYAASTAVVGWADCDVRSWLYDSILPRIDSTVRNAMKPVVKSYLDYTTGSKATNQTYDTIWVPSRKELFHSGGNNEEAYGCVYDSFFTNNASRIKKIGLVGVSEMYWLRTAYSPSSAQFFAVLSNGGIYNYGYSANQAYYVVFGFCT